MIKLTKSTKSEEGQCRSCYSEADEVFVLSVGTKHRTTSVQVCYKCLTTELGDLIGDPDDAIALVRALIEYKDLEKEILE